MTKKGRHMATCFSLVMYYCILKIWSVIVICFFHTILVGYGIFSFAYHLILVYDIVLS